MTNLPKSQFGNNSVGFVYFDNSANNSTGLSESFDYIEFSNTGSPKGGFSPSDCSSPQQFRKRNNFRGKLINKCNRYHGSDAYKYYSKDNSSNSCNNTLNKSNNKKKQDKKRNKPDISQYFHPSMIEDPWAELEKEMDPDSQDNSDPIMSEPFDRFVVDSNTNNLGDDTTDSQDESQVSTEESSC